MRAQNAEHSIVWKSTPGEQKALVWSPLAEKLLSPHWASSRYPFLDINTYSGFKASLRSRKCFTCSHNSAKWVFFHTFPQISMLAPMHELGVSDSKRETEEKVKWEVQPKGRVYKELPTSKYWCMSQPWQGKLETDHTVRSLSFNWLNLNASLTDVRQKLLHFSCPPASLSERCTNITIIQSRLSKVNYS